MICLTGPSASGKTTIECWLENLGYQRVISYTSREPRAGEIEDLSYHFISAERFAQLLDEGFFVEHVVYNGYSYGIAAQDCADDRVAVVEPAGLRALKALSGLHVLSFYLEVPESIRAERMLERGDSVDAVYARIVHDRKHFAGAAQEADYILLNDSPREGAVAAVVARIIQISNRWRETCNL